MKEKLEKSVNILPESESKVVLTPPPQDSPYGYLVVLASFFMQACSFGVANAFGVFVEHYSNTTFQGSDKAYISIIGTVAPTTIALASIFTGKVIELIGIRKCVLLGAVLVSLSQLISSFTTEIWHLIITQGFIFGLGGALIFVPANAIVIQWFDKRRGIAIGLATSGSSAGGLIFSLLNEHLLSKLGHRATLRYNALIYLTLLLFSSFVVKPRIQEVNEKGKNSATNLKSLINVSFILFMLAMLFASFGYLVPMFYIPLYAISKGYTKPEGAALLAIINGVSAFGRVLLGLLSDKLGHLNVFIACLGASASFLIIWIFASNYTTLLVFAVLYGLPNGGFAGGFTTACAELFGTENLATILGVVYAPTGLGDLAGTPLAGLILDKSHNYTYLIYYALAMSGASFLTFCIIAFLNKSKKNTIAMDEFS